MCDDEFQYRFVSITMQFDKVCDRSVGKKESIYSGVLGFTYTYQYKQC